MAVSAWAWPLPGGWLNARRAEIASKQAGKELLRARKNFAANYSLVASNRISRNKVFSVISILR
jgi:hypothetical protein